MFPELAKTSMRRDLLIRTEAKSETDCSSDMSEEPGHDVGLSVRESKATCSNHPTSFGTSGCARRSKAVTKASKMNHHIGRVSATTVSLSISDQLLRELWIYSLAVDREISGIGEVHGSPSNLLVTAPMHLLKQQGNYVKTVLDINEVMALLEQYITTGKDPETLCFWYHSHAYHPSFFSEQDHATIRKLSAMMPVCVAGVVNHRGDSAWEVIIENAVTYSFSLTIPGVRPTKAETDLVHPYLDKIFTILPPQTSHEALTW